MGIGEFIDRISPGPKAYLPKGFVSATKCIQQPFIPLSKRQYKAVVRLASENKSDVVLFDGTPMTFGNTGSTYYLVHLTDVFLQGIR
jgi:hypothetical protein